MGLAGRSAGSVLRGLLGEDPGGCKGFRSAMTRVLSGMGGRKSTTLFTCAGRFSGTSIAGRAVHIASTRVRRTCTRVSPTLLKIVHGTLIGVHRCRRGRVRGD